MAGSNAPRHGSAKAARLTTDRIHALESMNLTMDRVRPIDNAPGKALVKLLEGAANPVY